MSAGPLKILQQARAAIREGKAAQAQQLLEKFPAILESTGIDSAERPAIEAALNELRVLAEAALAGTRAAVEQVTAIIDCARSLQTYDPSGRRRVTPTQPAAPHRY